MNRDLEKHLRSCGFVLVRAKRHLVYRHTNGRTLVVSKTASDWRAAKDVERNIRNILKGANDGRRGV